MIALLCSVENEADILLNHASIVRTVETGSLRIREGSIAGRQVTLCIGGMGKVNAAHAAALLLSGYHPEALIVFGIGGAYASSSAMIGDIALADGEIAGDEGVLTQEGFRDTEYIGIPLVCTDSVLLHNLFPANGPLLQKAAGLLRSFAHPGSRLHIGRFVTLSTSTGTSLRAAELERRYHGLCENMEGAAVAQVAALHDMPWLEIRGISNMVEDRDLKKWDMRGAAETVQEAVIHVLKGWSS